VPYLIGLALALMVCALAAWVGFDRDRAFYPVLLVVVASYYVLFAVIGGERRALLVETIIMVAFVVVALIGFSRSLWLVVAALAVHGLMDVFHGALVTNPGVPAWWPSFCLTFDITAAAYLAWVIQRDGRAAPPAAEEPPPLSLDV
jgi:hypothetical protein